MIFWKVVFEDGAMQKNTGYLVFDNNMVEEGLYTLNGKRVTMGVSYTPVTGVGELVPPVWSTRYL